VLVSGRSTRAVKVRRALVMAVAIILVGVAEVGAVLSAGGAGVSRNRARSEVRAAPPTTRPLSDRYGEPHIGTGATAPVAPLRAAIRFVRDYALWSQGHLPRLPAGDATTRVIRQLEQRGRIPTGNVSQAVSSVHVEPGGSNGYVVTTIAGNFLVGRRGSRWVVVSLPGD
jgi:hypothetical protein